MNNMITAASSIAGLFHDFGKANQLFQKQLRQKKRITQPYRHEWISLLCFEKLAGGLQDEEWLNLIVNGDYSRIENIDLNQTPFVSLSPFASLIGWLIVSHHRLPMHYTGTAPDLKKADQWFDLISPSWNSKNHVDIKAQKLVEKNLKFCADLPNECQKWRENAAEAALLALSCDIPSEIPIPVFHKTRLCLMLADHLVSSRDDIEQNGSVYANTTHTGELKQKLSTHCIEVARTAADVANSLESLPNALPAFNFSNHFPNESGNRFAWQDAACEIVKTNPCSAFFGVNVASTGKGKTLANAKVMQALSGDEPCRFNVALGLRTLTLQTAKELRAKLNQTSATIAAVIGGTQDSEENDLDRIESSELIEYDGAICDWLEGKDKEQRLISAPILASTIDQVIRVTEGTRGGRHIAAMLRLMTSDLIIDEADDLGKDDHPALCRLVWMAGLFGRRVLIASATLPPSLCRALFSSYKKGREQLDGAPVHCAWIDEFDAVMKVVPDVKQYKLEHEAFMSCRAESLRKESVRQLPCVIDVPSSDVFVETIHKKILELSWNNKETSKDKSVSVGLVRFEHIKTIEIIADQLAAIDSPEDVAIHYQLYHSRFPMAVRSEIESRLDNVLHRSNAIHLDKSPITTAMERSNAKHHIFVVLASPVAEVGRDHDYDFAIIEPSSVRSIIQTAGRVNRHRQIDISSPNVAILSQNYRALCGKPYPYSKVGFETAKAKIHCHNIFDDLVDITKKGINSIPRIIEPKDLFNGSFHSVEHLSINQTLAMSAPFWRTADASLFGEFQRVQKFRESPPTDTIVIKPGLTFYRVSEDGTLKKQSAIELYKFKPKARNVFSWFGIDTEDLMYDLVERMSMSIDEVCEKFFKFHIDSHFFSD